MAGMIWHQGLFRVLLNHGNIGIVVNLWDERKVLFQLCSEIFLIPPTKNNLLIHPPL
jgi:hypothetical protein